MSKITKGTINLGDGELKYKFDFQNRIVILADNHDNVNVMTFVEWFALIGEWVEAYKEDLRS